MRIVSVLALLMVAVGCASTPDVAFECSEPRPQVCTMEFAPTCARLSWWRSQRVCLALYRLR